MNNLKKTTAQESHPAATAEKMAPHYPLDGNHHPVGDSIKKTAFENLLNTEEELYQEVSLYLTEMLVRMKVPRSWIEDLVQEAWKSAAEHREIFAEKDVKPRLYGLLRRVAHDKAVDLFRHLDHCPCESLDAEGIEPIDGAEAKRAETSEQREMLDALLEEVRPDHEENMLLLRLHYFQGFSIQELAQRFGRTPKAVDNRIRRALIELRELAHLRA